MDIEEIRKIIELMKSSDLTDFEIEEDSFKLRISRHKGEHTTVLTPGTPTPFPGHYSEPPLPIPQESSPPAEPDEEPADFINSPMVGTFYRASSPESPAFVEKGNEVGEETIVCIIEAMKVMNEIQAEVSGEIVEILIENGQSVEFGQSLFKIKRS